MSKGSFYYYFDDKADLFTTVADLAWAIVLPVEQLDLEAFNRENYWSSLEGADAGSPLAGSSEPVAGRFHAAHVRAAGHCGDS